MIRQDIKSCSVFSLFSEEEQERFFSVTGKKVIHNIDTLYYSVSMEEPSGEDFDCVTPLLRDLRDLRDTSEDNFDHLLSNKWHLVHLIQRLELDYKPSSFAHYRHCLSLKDEFDIFIAEYLPNKNTPRFVVQLRSIALWSYGDKACIKKSFSFLRDICRHFNIFINEVRENRIDYAFHTNCIQNATSYFTDDMLLKSLKSDLTKYQKVGNIGEEITIEYLSLGLRQSNNVLFRCYNKTREVVEMGYKSIFISIWYDNKLISEYDKFVLERAYQFGSKTGFDSAVALGKIDWYLSFGNDDMIKNQLLDLRDTYLKDGKNNKQLGKELKKILPEITSIMNFEFQTKRRYYRVKDKSIDKLTYDDNETFGYPQLIHLFQILDNRALFLDSLTFDTVRFVKDRNKAAKEIETSDFLDFWQRIRTCKTPCACHGELIREYARNVDKKRAVKGIADKVATLSVLKDYDGEGDFTSDFADMLCFFNDNDVNRIIGCDTNGELKGELQFAFDNYDILRGRKKRQYKFLANKEETAQEALSDEDSPSGNG